jgi:hypothetical protein
MSHNLQFFGVACAAMLLAGCATRYGPYHRWMNTGYMESRVSTNSFQVVFHGDRQYSRSHAAHFGFLRCAELAMENGFACYKIQSFIIRTNTRTRIEDRFGPAGLKPAYATSTNYSVSIAFDCFDGSAGAGFIDAPAQAYSIREKYKLPPRNYGLRKSGSAAGRKISQLAEQSAAGHAAIETPLPPQTMQPLPSADADDSQNIP